MSLVRHLSNNNRPPSQEDNDGKRQVSAATRLTTLGGDHSIVLLFLALEAMWLYYGLVVEPSLVLSPAYIVIPLDLSAAAALAVRKRYPVLVVAWVLVVGAIQWALFKQEAPVLISLIPALFAVTAYSPNRKKAFWVSSISIVAFLIFENVSLAGDVSHFISILQGLVLSSAIAVAGDHSWHRRVNFVELTKKHELLEQSRAAEVTQIAQAERSRVARELHDVIAHSVSVMVVQAGAARRVQAASPKDCSLALESIERTGRESLNDLRRVLGLLRDGTNPDRQNGELVDYDPFPSLDRLPRLIEAVQQTGIDIQLIQTYSKQTVPAAVELAAYRIVQEALTNIVKHAGPSSVTIATEIEHNILAVSIIDDGKGAASEPTGGTGRGLVGMKERVQLFDGDLHTGPRRGGGFEVIAVLPFKASEGPLETDPMPQKPSTNSSYQDSLEQI